MWNTKDGYVLRLPQNRLRAIAAGSHGRDAGSCGCSACGAQSMEAMENEIGALVRRSRRAGSVRNRKTGRSHPLFVARRGSKRYRIVTQPLSGVEQAVVAVSPRPVVQVEPEPVVDAAPEEPAAEPQDEPGGDEPAAELMVFTPELDLRPEHLETYGYLQQAEQMLEEAELLELTFELLSVTSEAELDLFLGGLVKSVARAASNVAKGVAKGVQTVGKIVPLGALADIAARTPIGALAKAGYGALSAMAKGENILKGALRSLASDPLMRFAIDTGLGVARGENIVKAAKQAVKAGIKDATEAVRFAAMVAPFVPGVGSGVAAALGAASALASGQPITAALIAAARSAIPGGALAQAAFDTAANLARGKSLSEAALGAARGQLPPGPAQAAFDAGLTLAKGKSLQAAAFAAAGRLLPPSPYAADALSFARRVAAGENLGKAALSTAGNAVMRRIEGQGGNILATLKGKVSIRELEHEVAEASSFELLFEGSGKKPVVQWPQKDPLNVILEWTGPHDYRSAIKVRAPGVYIFEKDGEPFYVGESGDVGKRLRSYKKTQFTRGKAYIGKILNAPFDVLGHTLGAVEHAVIRTITNKGNNPGRIKNERSTGALKTVGQIVIKNVLPTAYSRLPVPGGNVQNLVLTVAANGVYEIAPLQ